MNTVMLCPRTEKGGTARQRSRQCCPGLSADTPARSRRYGVPSVCGIKKEGCQPSRLDLALHSEIRTHKKASHFSLPRNGRQFTKHTFSTMFNKIHDSSYKRGFTTAVIADNCCKLSRLNVKAYILDSTFASIIY